MKKKSSDAQGSTPKVGGYIRVSSLRQANDGDSLEARRNMITAYVLSKEKLKSLDIEFYEDAGRSGKDQNRPELQRLKQDIRENGISHVIAFKLDRITRSLLDFAELWPFFDDHDVEFISLRESFDMSTPIGRAMLHIALVFAQMEREQTSERTRSVMTERIKMDFCNGGLHWGYQRQMNAEGKLEIDLEWAKIIRLHFFDAFEKLGSIGAVTRQLLKWGIRVPVRHRSDGTTRRGKPFTKQQVGRVLGYEFYIGTLRWGAAFKERCHEPIIDDEQFQRVQRLLEQTRATRKNHQKVNKYPYLLRGLVRCKCGHMMTPYPSTGRGGESYHYYGCTNRFHRGSGSCDAPCVSAPALDRAIVARMLLLAGDEKGQDRIAKLAIEMADENVSRLRAEMDAVRHRIGEVQKEINNLVQTIKTFGASAMDAVQEGLRSSQQEQEQLKLKLSELSKRAEKHQSVSDQSKQFLEGWQHVKEVLVKADPVQQRTVVQHYISAIKWEAAGKDGKEGTYVLKFFPEVVRGQGDDGDPQPSPTPEEPTPEATKPYPVLTENGVVLSVDEKAPRSQPSS